MVPLLEDAKKMLETGTGRPGKREAAALVRTRKANLLRFRDDSETPNNARLPLIHYRSPVKLSPGYDPAAMCACSSEAPEAVS
jgi:hypothetical protein